MARPGAHSPLLLRWNLHQSILLWDNLGLELMATIHKMKSYKAPGADGWRAQELKLVPFSAIIDLALIFDQIWPSQFQYTESQMLVHVILLAKVPHPDSFSDGRPITIRGYIPRFSSKMIADQCLAAPKIAGGLPFRSVKDITIQQQFLLKRAHKTNVAHGGFTLDLVVQPLT